VNAVDLARLRLLGAAGSAAAEEIVRLRRMLAEASDGCVECAKRKLRLSEARRRNRRSEKRFGKVAHDKR
jgi:hypothetical protein